MGFCLDTNTIVCCLRGKPASAMRRLRVTPAADIRVPMEVLAELLVGAAKSARPAANGTAGRAFIKPYVLIWPDDAVVAHYVSIRCALEATGQSIGEADLWIAASARSRGDVAVTNKTDEFKRVLGLVVEDWSRLIV